MQVALIWNGKYKTKFRQMINANEKKVIREENKKSIESGIVFPIHKIHRSQVPKGK